uniref:Proteasome 20S subunit beta 6 n=1 Tax=Sinocyclocheilus grahami TaxID=75366 RepID=A0A672K971_SINGR
SLQFGTPRSVFITSLIPVGTSIMAVEFEGGVVIGADSRTTTGIELDEAPLVQTAASLFREMCYRYREELMAGIIVAGWDPRRGGQVYTVPVGGMMTRQPVSVGGSGSSYIYGYVDSNYRAGMSKEECLKFTAEGQTHTHTQTNGGVVRLAVVSEQGVERQVILGNQLPKFSTV